MPARLVPTVQTKYTLNQLIKGLVDGWYKKFGVIPEKKQIAVLYAQNALETGGTVSMWNNNIGNVKFVPSKNQDYDTGIDYMMLANTWEMINGKKVIFPPEHPASYFRHYNKLSDAMIDYLQFVSSKNYEEAFKALKTGDPAAYTKALKRAKYYTAPEEEYTKAVVSIFNDLKRKNLYPQAMLKIDLANNNNEDDAVDTPIHIPIHVEIEKPKNDDSTNELVKLSLWQQIIKLIKIIIERLLNKQ